MVMKVVMTKIARVGMTEQGNEGKGLGDGVFEEGESVRK